MGAEKLRVLVTGGAGFIGSHLARQLAGEGHPVHLIVRPEDSLDRLRDCLDRLDVRTVNLLDHAAVRQVVLEVKPDLAIHAAWYLVPGRYWAAPENADCVTMTLALARALEAAGCRRLVGVGSCFEYDVEYGYLSESLTPLNPRTLYGIAKNATRSVLEAFCRETAMSFAWTRVFYLYGPGEEKDRLVPAVILALLKGATAKCSEGFQVRDYLCVEDVASAILAVTRSKFEGAVNIGSGEPVTVRRIVHLIGETLEGSDRIAFGAVKTNPVDPPFLLADVRRLQNDIGWRPSYGLEAGLRRAVEWWREQLAAAGSNL
jgi:nucleoside-diphosphate-sugar epimerase